MARKSNPVPPVDETRRRERPPLAVLLHGFFRGHRDMAFMARGLEDAGYRTVCPALPTTRGDLDACVSKLWEYYQDYVQDEAQVYVVAHSMGGLVMRALLADHVLPNVQRCVLIGTPNSGTKLANIVWWIQDHLPDSLQVLGGVKDLRHGTVEIPPPRNDRAPEIGVIGGTCNRIPFGLLAGAYSDGRVPVSSLRFSGMKELRLVSHTHHSIHHSDETVILVRAFLKNGTFS